MVYGERFSPRSAHPSHVAFIFHADHSTILLLPLVLIRTVTFESHTEPQRQRQSDCDVMLEVLGRVDDLDTDLGQCRICSLMHAPYCCEQ